MGKSIIAKNTRYTHCSLIMQERTKLLFIDKQFQNSYPKFIVGLLCQGADKRVFLYILYLKEIFFKARTL